MHDVSLIAGPSWSSCLIDGKRQLTHFYNLAVKVDGHRYYVDFDLDQWWETAWTWSDEALSVEVVQLDGADVNLAELLQPDVLDEIQRECQRWLYQTRLDDQKPAGLVEQG